MGQRVFVTGATGVLGRRVVPRLVEAGHHVTAVVRHAYSQFQSSRVRDFIPLLVQRRADEELEELSVLRPDLAAVALDDMGVTDFETIAAV